MASNLIWNWALSLNKPNQVNKNSHKSTFCMFLLCLLTNLKVKYHLHIIALMYNKAYLHSIRNCGLKSSPSDDSLAYLTNVLFGSFCESTSIPNAVLDITSIVYAPHNLQCYKPTFNRLYSTTILLMIVQSHCSTNPIENRGELRCFGNASIYYFAVDKQSLIVRWITAIKPLSWSLILIEYQIQVRSGSSTSVYFPL
jgi:hypothetical protein